MIEIKVPELGESIQEVQISEWLVKEGDFVEQDQDIVELESEKAAQSLAAPKSGVISKLHKQTGDFAEIGTLLAELDETATSGSGSSSNAQASSSQSAGESSPSNNDSATAVAESTPASTAPSGESRIMPAAERMLDEYKISADVVTPSGPGGRLLKEDVIRYIEANGLLPGGKRSAEPASTPKAAPAQEAPITPVRSDSHSPDRKETVKPMSMIRRTIAARLVEAQQTAALLTTFNEIDMKPVMELRAKYKDQFLKKHGVKLGFMSFFAKASVEALRRFNAINAEVRGNDVVYRNYQDIGVAIGGGKGLVVPVLRDVQRMSFADIEQQIGQFAELAQSNKLKPQDLEGGTFTISNGGVYGSLLSTPIINPPQSGILGLHAIQERPVAVDGQVVIRPMMYVALSYDHRIVDGREAVGFLRTIKDVLEEPARLFLEV